MARTRGKGSQLRFSKSNISTNLTGKEKPMSRIRQKGQITIPQEIRDKLKLTADTEVEFSIEGDAIVIRAVEDAYERARRRVERARGGATIKGWTTDELMAIMRGDD